MLATAQGVSPLAQDLFVVLATAAVVALVMVRLRQAVIPAYLLAGALVGPNALHLVRSAENLESISRLAIILLMFGIGLQLHLSALRHALVRMAAIGIGACLLCAGAGWPVVMVFGLKAPAALAVSMALALSSTAVVLRILAGRRELSHTSGRLALAILVVQDLVVLLMLASLPVLGKWAAAGADVSTDGMRVASWGVIFRNEILRAVGLVLVVLMCRAVIPRLVGESVRGGSPEVTMIVSVVIALGSAALTERLGLSLEMGAFLAGFLLASSPFRHEIAGQIGPLRDLFIAVFFTTVGMGVNPATVVDWWWLILLGLALLLAVKTLMIALACWSLGATTGTALYVGLSLSQAGEFSLVLLAAGGIRYSAGASLLISSETMGICIAVVVLSLIATPALIGLGYRLSRRHFRLSSAPWVRTARFYDAPPEPGHLPEAPTQVIVAGYGPMGRRVTEELERAGILCTIIELNPRTVRKESMTGRAVVFGDASNPEVLTSAGIASADALILTIPDDEAAARACAAARRLSPKLYIAARAGASSRLRQLSAAGADHVTVDELAAAEDMAVAVRKHMGVE